MTDQSIAASKARGNGAVLHLEPVDKIEWELDSKGKIRPNENNFRLAMNDAKISFRYNEFTGDGFVYGIPDYGPRMADPEYGELYLLLQRLYGFKIGREDLRDIVRAQMRRNRFHPVRDYLDGLEWDGVERIGEWLHAYAGAKMTPYIAAVGKIMLIAAARRIYEPGCKFDEMPIFESPEGRLKSTALLILAGEDNFSDHAPFGLEPRQVIEVLRGKWIVECAELDTMNKTEVTALKSFLSRREDRAALKYERETTAMARHCVFWGTTNEENYLASKTGNRRFWPIRIEMFDLDSLRRDRDQLWAEAVYHHRQGASIRLPEQLWSSARAEQEEREVRDEWEGLIAEHLNAKADTLDWAPNPVRVRIIDVANEVLHMQKEKLDMRTANRIAECMKRCNWKMTLRSHGNRWWTYEPLKP
jgi:predicted P-loop ATPase